MHRILVLERFSVTLDNGIQSRPYEPRVTYEVTPEIAKYAISKKFAKKVVDKEDPDRYNTKATSPPKRRGRPPKKSV